MTKKSEETTTPNEGAKPKKTDVVDIEANIGDEITIRCNGSKLVIKVGDGILMPDFFEGMTRAIIARPHAVAVASQRIFHHEKGAANLLQLDVAELRDLVFKTLDPK